MSDYSTDDVCKTIRLIRPDLVRDTEDAEQSRLRLIINGYREFPGLVDKVTVSDVKRQLVEPGIAGKRGRVLTRLVYEIWLMRKDLRTLYDLETDEGQEKLLWWFFLCGVSEYGVTDFLSAAQDVFLFESDGTVSHEGSESLKLPRLARYIWEQRPDLQAAFDLTRPEGVGQMISWFYQFGFAEAKLAYLIIPSRRVTLLEVVTVGGARVPRLAYWLWQGSSRLKERFAQLGGDDFRYWYEEEAPKTVPLLAFLNAQSDVSADRGWPYATVPKVAQKAGVNLVGYARGQSGVGEDIRAAAKALQVVGVSFSIINIDPGSAVSSSVTSGLEQFYDYSLPYDTTLFCITAVEMLTLAARHGGALFSSTKIIAYWPWELAEWPKQLLHAYRFVDEIWASSSFTYNALVKQSPVPVRLAPMLVDVAASAGLGRQDFGLQEQVFYFVYSFDFLSMASRKNPFGVIRAFHKAFKKDNFSVGLVLKSMRHGHASDVWDSLEAEARNDSRVILQSQTLERSAVLDLYRACNCFVSLHRSEGFGRGIAESMLLGKPVIATAYSGSLDFTSPGNAALVDYRLKPVEKNEYPYGDQQVWADPDIEQAAWWMQELVSDSALSQRFAANGLQSVNAGYSAEVVGKRYLKLLKG